MLSGDDRREAVKEPAMPTIHPTAIVDPSAIIADSTEIGAYAIVEADCTIGAGTVLRSHAIVRRYTSLGEGNVVDSFVTLGGEPQDLKFDAKQVSFLKIGDRNTFREGVTISRATGEGLTTTVGNDNYWMANTHAGHNATIGNNVIMANGTLIAGHATIGDACVFGGCASVHQFVWIGQRVMLQGFAGISMHVPPFVICTQTNHISSLNSVGLRRAEGITVEDRAEVKEAFRLTYRCDLTPTKALAAMDEHTEWGSPAVEFREFVRKAIHAEKPHQRGLIPRLDRLASRRQRPTSNTEEA
jgi:UDP-N-acetylglucosamine acyltransferase